MDERELDALMDEARDAIKYTYSPYSSFVVGASVLTSIGNIYAASNIENASYSMSMCAERIALFKAISEGDLDIVAVAIYHSGTTLAMPCGACLQVMSEFADAYLKIFISNDEQTVESSLGELLPNAFMI